MTTITNAIVGIAIGLALMSTYFWFGKAIDVMSKVLSRLIRLRSDELPVVLKRPPSLVKDMRPGSYSYGWGFMVRANSNGVVYLDLLTTVQDKWTHIFTPELAIYRDFSGKFHVFLTRGVELDVRDGLPNHYMKVDVRMISWFAARFLLEGEMKRRIAAERTVHDVMEA